MEFNDYDDFKELDVKSVHLYFHLPYIYTDLIFLLNF